jgi:hypothetical protein
MKSFYGKYESPPGEERRLGNGGGSPEDETLLLTHTLPTSVYHGSLDYPSRLRLSFLSLKGNVKKNVLEGALWVTLRYTYSASSLEPPNSVDAGSEVRRSEGATPVSPAGDPPRRRRRKGTRDVTLTLPDSLCLRPTHLAGLITTEASSSGIPHLLAVEGNDEEDSLQLAFSSPVKSAHFSGAFSRALGFSSQSFEFIDSESRHLLATSVNLIRPLTETTFAITSPQCGTNYSVHQSEKSVLAFIKLGLVGNTGSFKVARLVMGEQCPVRALHLLSKIDFYLEPIGGPTDGGIVVENLCVEVISNVQ